MALPIKLKTNNTTGAVPTTAELLFGELAVNTFDGTVYFKRDNGSGEEIVQLQAAGTTTAFLDLSDTPVDYAGAAGQVLIVNATEDGVEFTNIAPGGVNSVTAGAGLANSGTALDPVLDVNAGTGLSIVSDTLNVDFTTTSTINGSLNIAARGDHTHIIGFLDDVDTTGVTDGQVLAWNNTAGEFQPVTITSGSTTFTGLTDTPTDYTGQSGQFVAVNGTEDALEFVAPPTGTITGAANVGVGTAEVFRDETGGTLNFKTLSPGSNISFGGDANNILISADDTSFVALTDTPANYSGAASNVVKVNVAGTALIFDDNDFVGLSDTPVDYSGAGGQVLRVNGGETAVTFGDFDFIELTDTPANYTGAVGQFVRVNAAGNGLEFVAAPSGVTEFTGLTDTPANFTGAAGQVVAVNVGETALEFITPPSGVTEFTALTDTPANYSGAANEIVKVNPAGTALVFDTNDFVGLTDTPVDYSGAAGQVLQVNGAETAVTFTDFDFVGLTDTPANYTGATTNILRVNAAGNAVEFGAELGNLDDVSSSAPNDGDVLTWNNTGSTWEPAAPGATSSTVESIRINYNALGTITSVQDATSGITSTTIEASRYVNFEFSYNRPPTSIIYYAYQDLTGVGGFAGGFGYKMTMPALSSALGNIVDTGGSAGSPGELLTNMVTGKIRLQLNANDTAGAVNEHTIVFFMF
jgi:hypothetical protein